MVLLKFFYFFNISIYLSYFRIWYTLTGNFGNLLPIDYWSKSLIRKYHNNSLNIKNNKKTSSNRNHLNGKNKPNLNEMRLSQTFSNSKFHINFLHQIIEEEEENERERGRRIRIRS